MTDEAQAQAIVALPRDLAIIKMENETIVAMAAARPRNYKKILEDLKEQLAAYPTFAAAAVYCKPIGRNKDGEMEFAEGLSVRAAEALAEAYGFNRVSTYIDTIEDDSDKLRVTASFTDYQRGRSWTDSVVVSAWYRTKYGKMKRHNEDRFHNIVAKAERSRLVREVIVRSVPAGLKSELMAIALRLQEKGLDDKAIEKILAAWEGKGVDLDALEKIIGKTRANWTVADRKRLVHLWQAVKDGETSVAEILQRDESKEEPTVVEGSGSDLFNVGGEAELTDEERHALEEANAKAGLVDALEKSVAAAENEKKDKKKKKKATPKEKGDKYGVPQHELDAIMTEEE